LGVAWTDSAVADFESLVPDDNEIELVQQALHTHSTSQDVRRADFLLPYANASNPTFVLRASRFALIYQATGDLLVTAVRESLDVSLSVLICDQDEQTRSMIEEVIQREPDITQVLHATHETAALFHLNVGHVNTIFVDPLTMGLDAAADFILKIQQSHPYINVVLYVDEAIAEEHCQEFFQGERNVFFQYNILDKKTPPEIFQAEVAATLKTCRRKLKWKAAEASVKEVLRKTESQQTAEKSTMVPPGLLKTARAGLEELSHRAGIAVQQERAKSIFLSYRFDDQEIMNGFRELLELNGFTVYTGEDAGDSIHLAILERIRTAEFFLSLMSHDEEKKDGSYTASPWVLEEKGAALAFGKRPVLMVQEGIKRTGGLHGDRQVIYFTLKNLMTQALKAVRQLKSYMGDPSDPKQ
jgi:CheY-like chemotaxis protein